MELKYYKDRQEREEEEERIKNEEARLKDQWELKRLRAKVAEQEKEENAKVQRRLVEQQIELERLQRQLAEAAERATLDTELGQTKDTTILDLQRQILSEREERERTAKQTQEAMLEWQTKAIRENDRQREREAMFQKTYTELKARNVPGEIGDDEPTPAGTAANGALVLKPQEDKIDQFELAERLLQRLYGTSPDIPEHRTYQTRAGDERFSVRLGSESQTAFDELRSMKNQYISQHASVVSSIADPAGTSGWTSSTEQTESSHDSPVRDSMSTESGLDRPGQHDRHVILLPTYLNSRDEHTKLLDASLAEHGIRAAFPVKGNGRPRAGASMSDDLPLDRCNSGTLMWNAGTVVNGSELHEALRDNGWRPVYMRGSVTGQTWFYGSRPVHVRFLSPEYIPNLDEDDLEGCSDEYLVIGAEWIVEDALRLSGVEYTFVADGFWMLDHSVSYDELRSLIATSFMLKEVTMRKASRKALAKGSSTSKEDRTRDAALLTTAPEPLKILDEAGK